MNNNSVKGYEYFQIFFIIRSVKVFTFLIKIESWALNSLIIVVIQIINLLCNFTLIVILINEILLSKKKIVAKTEPKKRKKVSLNI